jgi:hypothetical protein
MIEGVNSTLFFAGMMEQVVMQDLYNNMFAFLNLN